MLLLIPGSPFNPHKIDFSEMVEIMLDFEGNLATKKESAIIITSEIGSSERMERKIVESVLKTTLIDKLYQVQWIRFSRWRSLSLFRQR